MRLSRRLLAIAELVPGGECLADVGCDHGYLPIHLIKQGRCKRAIAMDVRPGPLQCAKAHIREMQLEDYIETRLSDGLSALKKGEAGQIVVAGMGGALMTRILDEGEPALEEDTVLILQPQSEIMEFRRYLTEHGYRFLKEQMVKEGGKFYPMMQVRKGDGKADFPYSFLELKYGPVLLQDKHPVLWDFLQNQKKKQEEIVRRLELFASLQEREEHMRLACRELEEIGQALKRYEEIV